MIYAVIERLASLVFITLGRDDDSSSEVGTEDEDIGYGDEAGGKGHSSLNITYTQRSRAGQAGEVFRLADMTDDLESRCVRSVDEGIDGHRKRGSFFQDPCVENHDTEY